MNEREARAEAKYLHRLGYRRTSNKYNLVARIDRPNWIYFMASQHPDINEGFEWAVGLGLMHLSDHYIRVYSADAIQVHPEVYRYMHSCMDHPPHYRDPKETE